MKLNSLVIVFVLAGVLNAGDVVLQPPRLEPGDQYRLIFTTSAKRDASSSNIEDYNNFVQSVADSSPELAAWDLDWKAIASTSSTDAVDNTATDWRAEDGLPIYRLDGRIAYLDNHDLWLLEAGDGPHQRPLDIDETASVIPLPLGGEITVLTGTNSAGLRGPTDIPIEFRGLGNVTSATGSAHGRSPRARFALDSARLGAVHHFYAISEIVTAVPEPATHLSALATIIGIISFSTRRRRRKRIEAVTFL